MELPLFESHGMAFEASITQKEMAMQNPEKRRLVSACRDRLSERRSVADGRVGSSGSIAIPDINRRCSVFCAPFSPASIVQL
jgi:hypothetical protein